MTNRTRVLLVSAVALAFWFLASAADLPRLSSCYASVKRNAGTPASSVAFSSSRAFLSIRVRPPREAVTPLKLKLGITDPAGEIVGYTAAGGAKFQEGPPRAVYDVHEEQGSLPWPLGPGRRSVHIDFNGPSSGLYKVMLFPTGTSIYDLEFIGLDRELGRSGFELRGVPIAASRPHGYSIRYSDAPGERLLLAGKYLGTSKDESAAANRLISFAHPLTAVTRLAGSESRIDLIVFYDSSIDTASFLARLNEKKISTLFKPKGGSFEIISLRLPRKRCVLQLRAKSKAKPPLAKADYDVLLFLPTRSWLR